ncbi:S49 family peptidase [Sciscionella sediminilitoris]|uniref:S49 family peptidase n=1 Tax=Sciscionella sediminilitoris TaxID=1445613 RepID=UPI0004DF3A2D|nr:S49 family peptidase [Sciscionella sp. SE31]
MNVMEKLTANLPGIERIERGDVVSVVRLHGVISSTPSPLSRGVINLNAADSAIKKAFEHDRLKAVALAINSPGGMPTQSALVAERIRGLADEKNIPVLAFCEDLTASGGYWIACAADEIYAHRTSMVGSIGVVSASFGVRALAEKLGVERRVHTAGASKHRLDPFDEEKPEDLEWLRGIQSALHEQFADWVRERRGDRLSTDRDLFDGDVWDGKRAAELGITDGVGSLREVIERRYPDAKLVVAEPRKPLLARLGVGAPAASLLQAAEHRLAWTRFGL